MTVVPDYLRRHPHPPPHSGTAHQRVDWMRQFIRSYAEYHAVLAVAGMDDVAYCVSEVGLAAAGAARDLEWPIEIAASATYAEWQRGLDLARQTADRVIEAVRWPIRRHEPGEEILARAAAANVGCVFPTDILIEICAKAAQAGARRRVRA